jgi:hypothetical protein
MVKIEASDVETYHDLTRTRGAKVVDRKHPCLAERTMGGDLLVL